MAYIANQYNYATPLFSSKQLLSDVAYVDESTKYFTLFDNKLDGTYRVISGDVGLWGAYLSDTNGGLSVPYTLTVDLVEQFGSEVPTIGSINVIGSRFCYPVDFILKVYKDAELIHDLVISGNTLANRLVELPGPVQATKYTLTVVKVSAPNRPIAIYNTYGATRKFGSATLSTKVSVSSSLLNARYSRDIIAVSAAEATPSKLLNTAACKDTIGAHFAESTKLTNVHTRMKEISRRIYGKVYITYTDPIIESKYTFESSGTAYNSSIEQIVDGVLAIPDNLFNLYKNDLSGDYMLSDQHTHVGWVSSQLSDEYGRFAEPQVLSVHISPRPLFEFSIVFAEDSIPADFTVTIINRDEPVVRSFTNNTLIEVPLAFASLVDASEVIVSISRIHTAGRPAIIADIPSLSTVLYTGYQDKSDLVSIDLLEELTYDDDVEALGGVSANEVTVRMDNSNGQFFFNNPNSYIAKYLRRNRRVEPWLGVEVLPGEIEWYKLGTYWSYNWNVPVNGLSASVTAFDTISLLDQTSFTDCVVQVNKSIGELVEYVLEDAKSELAFIKYIIDPALYEVIIPYAWFDGKSHTAALRKISQCYPMHIYCNRDGYICAAPQRLHLDHYYDVWADNTNVIDKTYDSLYTALPNVINVTVLDIKLAENTQLATDPLVFDVAQIHTRTLTFSNPYVSDIVVDIDCDATAWYTYKVYSWGIVIDFTGYGKVRAITCTGTSIDTSQSSVVSQRDNERVRIDGAITRDISADFIQTSELALYITNRILSLSETDKYDAKVNYRGDIALSINDPILLLNGIAPDNRYNIKRHELHWNGALTGSAYLNT